MVCGSEMCEVVGPTNGSRDRCSERIGAIHERSRLVLSSSVRQCEAGVTAAPLAARLILLRTSDAVTPVIPIDSAWPALQTAAE